MSFYQTQPHNHALLKWFASIGVIVISAVIIGTFTSIMQIEKSMIEIKTKQANIVESVQDIKKTTNKIDDRLHQLEIKKED